MQSAKQQEVQKKQKRLDLLPIELRLVGFCQSWWDSNGIGKSSFSEFFRASCT